MPIPKYHIYLEYAELDKSGYRYNLTEEELQRTFTSPYMEGKPFWFQGRLLNPHKVTKTVIFWSYTSADKLKLPNQENLLVAKDKKYAADAIEKGKVKGAYLCTEKYLTKPQAVTAPSGVSGSGKRRVLVACGSDDEMKEALIWALSKLWLVPVVLCEEPGHGKKIVERFVDYVDVGFAVVLLSPDDYVYAKGAEPTKRKLKPCQDVVFELGFLLGKLGKERVLVFFRESEKRDFEVNTDFEGIKTAPFDDRDSWKLALIRELAACGYVVEGDRILK
jgi:predicted nucleotide-binding protein